MTRGSGADICYRIPSVPSLICRDIIMNLRWIFCAAMLSIAAPGYAKAQSNCQLMQQLAQQHSNDMAHRDKMDHGGFHERAKKGARAENVAMGSTTKAGAMAQWWTSPGWAVELPCARDQRAGVKRYSAAISAKCSCE